MHTTFLAFVVFVFQQPWCHALEVDVWSPAAVPVGTPSVEIGCRYSFSPGMNVRVTSIEWQKEWPRGKGSFETIAIFYPPGGAKPSFSPTFVANQIKDRTNLKRPSNNSLTAKMVINDIKCEDDGTYKCSVQFDSNAGSGAVDKTVAMKTVAKGKAPYAAPVSSISGGLSENDNVDFTCKADLGKPPGKVRWWVYRSYKSNPQELTHNSMESPAPEGSPGICDNIVISKLGFHVNKDDHNAVIRCTVDQELLTSPTGKPQDMPYKETNRQTVFYRVRKPEIARSPDASVYYVDTPSLSIKCSTIGNPNPFDTHDQTKAKVTWYYKKSGDSQDILASRVPNVLITRREIRLQKLSLAQAGTYICEVQNSFKGNTYMHRSEVQIRIVPRVVNNDVSGVAVSIAGDSLTILLLLGIFFLLYRQVFQD